MTEKSVDVTCPCSVKSDLQKHSTGFQCSTKTCAHYEKGQWFQISRGIPVLISELNCDTICDTKRYLIDIEQPFVTRSEQKGPITKLSSRLLKFNSSITLENCQNFTIEIAKTKEQRVLVIGSGTVGQGMESLYACPAKITGIDIYGSSSVDYIADAHYLPFPNECFDGVWIQAVLEHVADPSAVVAEIFRVLKPSGLVYAETPFMQQVHEGAYDFTRFTVLGHRYLFKRFDAIKFGGNRGGGTVLSWALKYFLWGLLRNKKVAAAISLPIGFLLRPLERLSDKRILFDGSSGVFFLGKKSSEIIKQKELVLLYKGMQK
jgi:SAM-dependent methyltransferase